MFCHRRYVSAASMTSTYSVPSYKFKGYVRWIALTLLLVTLANLQSKMKFTMKMRKFFAQACARLHPLSKHDLEDNYDNVHEYQVHRSCFASISINTNIADIGTKYLNGPDIARIREAMQMIVCKEVSEFALQVQA